MKRLLIAMLSLACTPPVEGECVERPVLDDERSLRITAQRQDDRVRIVGRPGSASALEIDGRVIPLDESGAFNVQFDDREDIEVIADNETLHYRVREDSDLGCVQGPPRLTGTLPNDVAIAECEGRPVALVPNTGDGALQIFLDEETTGVPLPGTPERGAEPFHVAAAGGRAMVSLFGQHTAAWVDACSASLLHVPPRPSSLLVVAPPRTLTSAIDADGDGTRELEVSSMRPLHPQGVAIVDGRAALSFTGLLEIGPEPIFGPGYLAIYDIVDDELVESGGLELPCINPQGLISHLGKVWVSCSGALGRVDGRFAALTDGALLEIDLEQQTITRQLALGRFAPGSPSFSETKLVVGSLIRAEVLLFDQATLEETGRVALGDLADTDSIFELVSLPGEIVLAAVFNKGELRAIDTWNHTLDPFPFQNAIELQGSGPVHGALAATAVLANGRLRGYALLGLSNELVPLDFQQLMGP